MTLNLPANVPAPVRVRTPDNDRGIGSDRRTYEFQWIIGDTLPNSFDRDEENNGIRLTISHYKETKDYRATVKVIRVHDRGHMESFGFGGPRLDADLDAERAPRYSRKALDAFAARVLAGFPDSIPDDSEPGKMWAKIVMAAEDARILRKHAV